MKKETRGRKFKHNISEYLDDIYYVLKSGISWRMISIIKKKPTHHTTLFKFYRKLCAMNIFNIVYNRLLKNYRSKRLEELGMREYEKLYTDSTMIRNINGRECIGADHYDRFRNATKLNVIIDENNIPVGHMTVGANINDSILTLETIERTKYLHKNSYLIADKGYICEKNKRLLKKKHINFVYGIKKNQKKKRISKRYEELLKERITVEHFFARLKTYRRTRFRYDTTFISFENFIVLAFCDLITRL